MSHSWRVAAIVTWLLAAVTSASLFAECNFENHHTHIVVPLAATLDDCKEDGAPFLLTHGATFFCPHVYNVKLLATFDTATHQSVVCENYFAALDDPTGATSAIFALRPTLPVNGLPDSGNGLLSNWTSPVLYHVHEFGHNASAGPGAGWNTTTLLSENITVSFEPLYFAEFSLTVPRPESLTYLLFAAGPQLVLTNYVTTAPDFEQILLVKLAYTYPADLELSSTWPTRVTVNGFANSFDGRIVAGTIVGGVSSSLASLRVTSNETDSAPVAFVELQVVRELYAGVDDGFSDFGANCQFPPPYPQARGLCF